MSRIERETLHCPICNNLLEVDEDGGYFCPYCGWDESADQEDDAVWIVAGHGDDKEPPD